MNGNSAEWETPLSPKGCEETLGPTSNQRANRKMDTRLVNVVAYQETGGNEIKGKKGQTKPEKALQRPVTAMSCEECDKQPFSPEVDKQTENNNRTTEGGERLLNTR